jgi:hypothetical protein
MKPPPDASGRAPLMKDARSDSSQTIASTISRTSAGHRQLGR